MNYSYNKQNMESVKALPAVLKLFRRSSHSHLPLRVDAALKHDLLLKKKKKIFNYKCQNRAIIFTELIARLKDVQI